MFSDGGWFASGLRVQVRQNGVWTDVSGQRATPAYPYSASAGPNHTYQFDFTPTAADGVRIIGVPGGTRTFTSIGELEAYHSGGGSTGTPARYYVDTFAAAPVFASPTSTTQTGTLNAGTDYVYCKAWGRMIGNSTAYNHWWLRTDPDTGPAGQYVSAYYLSHWGNDEAKDNSGTVIPDC